MALSVVQAGLEEATHSPLGTGYGVFGDFPEDIAGKTGSAEKEVTVPGDPYDYLWPPSIVGDTIYIESAWNGVFAYRLAAP